jgi:hypothetical protein
MWNVDIGTEAAQFTENEYINGIFLAVCTKSKQGAWPMLLNKTRITEVEQIG